jgi:5-deoxy-glucuronate isomerase
MSDLLTAHRAGFSAGLTTVTTLDDPSGISLNVLKLAAGQVHAEAMKHETAFLLMSGRLEVEGALRGELERRSLFDDAPRALHLSAGAAVQLKAQTDVELCVFRAANARVFPPQLHVQVADEHRGKGKVHDAAYRFVRTVFDATNAPAEAELVLGEVINFPGRWSSYPPHHHPQPELYHYRFDRPDGYGHAELGEAVFKVKTHDTLRIMDGVDHPQCAAPGYAMWYAWVIRHLPQSRYGVPDFEPKHRWTMDDGAKGWWPRGVPEP